MTEQQIYESLCHWHGGPLPDKNQARVALLKRIQIEPSWECVLPETLLDKLNIKYDHVYQQGDVALAAAINGRLERRLL